MHTLLNTLYVLTPNTYVQLNNSAVHITFKHETLLRVPLHNLDGLVLFGNILISPALSTDFPMRERI
ncbi:CRISPR-associated endonuclease Cas1 [Caldichromatium japonicum]|uniref:CRISPR-associated endonuclease Cas1 n=1 Tax=Caldichromatium japonicum TaxID=2699430 RepID=UPI0024835F20|nr:CRISPR-associated endonuclease Cas1 [Caldichromatium japonicum]